MKKDKLNIDSFTSKEGKNYRRFEMLKKEEIGNYFSIPVKNILTTSFSVLLLTASSALLVAIK